MRTQGKPISRELSGEELQHLAEAYAYLMELAERDPRNIWLCQGILTALADFDLHIGETYGRVATSPYVELNEYLLYLLDIQKPAESKEQRAYEKKTLAQFRAIIMEFIKQYAPGFDDSCIRSKHKSLKPVEED